VFRWNRLPPKRAARPVPADLSTGCAQHGKQSEPQGASCDDFDNILCKACATKLLFPTKQGKSNGLKMSRKGAFSSFCRLPSLAHALLSPGLQPFAPKLSEEETMRFERYL
jgi:hypothetical protein